MSEKARPGLIAQVLIFLVRVYQSVLSPLLSFLGAQCRFHPTCSAYALASIEKHGALKGSLKAVGRLLRCHPLHPGGFDPP